MFMLLCRLMVVVFILLLGRCFLCWLGSLLLVLICSMFLCVW